MSNKTIFKRIALVAVAALGAGFLTVTPATAANNAAVGGTNATTAAGILNVATEKSITGDAVLSADGSGVSSKSLGILANSTTLTTSSLTSTATMRADGELVFYWTGTAAKKPLTVVVEGGVITGATAANTESININAAKTQAAIVATTGAVVANFSVSPNAGVTSMVVSAYEADSAVTNGDADDVAAIQAGTVSKGTLKQRYSVSVAASSVAGLYSPTYSYVQGVTDATATASSNVDVTDSLTIQNAASAVAYIAIDLKDAYNVTLDSVGALVVSSTNGAGVYYAGGSSAGTPTNTTAVSTDTSGTITVARPSAFANKAFSTTVTITWNGAVVGTKTVKFLGEVAKIVAAQYYISQAGATTTYQGEISYVDDAGNVLLPTSGTSAVSSTLNNYVTAASVGDWADAADPVSYYDVTCGGTTTSGAGAGSADVVFQHVNALSGTVIKSAPVKITCAGNPVTYTASLDKATYAPGEIATLTITGKDQQGNLANANYNFQSTTSGSEFTVTAPQMTAVTAISTSSVKLSSGAGTKTYKFVVGTTDGSYNAIVAIPTINALLLGGANQTVAYKVVTPSTGAVTNAEVLAAIVKLIASINKQIKALQKSLKK